MTTQNESSSINKKNKKRKNGGYISKCFDIQVYLEPLLKIVVVNQALILGHLK